MSTSMIVFILIFFLFIQTGITDTDADNDGNTVIDRYVPLGQHFNFTCDAYERIQHKFLQILSVQWLFRCSKNSVILDNNPNSRFIYDEKSYYLIGYEIERHHEGVLECRVLYYNSLTNESNIERSIINLKVQDCNENIDSNISHALRNPCQYGQCKIVSAKLGGIVHEKLYCDCAEQYTGLFCDVEKIGTWWRETLYYSSTFGHFLCTGLIFLSFYCFDRANSNERISLKDEVPDFGRIREDFDLLYPAARIEKKKPTPEAEGTPAATPAATTEQQQQQDQQQQQAQTGQDNAAPEVQPPPNNADGGGGGDAAAPSAPEVVPNESAAVPGVTDGNPVNQPENVNPLPATPTRQQQHHPQNITPPPQQSTPPPKNHQPKQNP